MPLDFKGLIAKAGLTEDEQKAALSVFSTDKLGKLIEEDAMHTAEEAFKADRAKMQTNWDTANAEYLEMQGKLGATQAEKDATAAALLKAQTELAAADTKVKTMEGFDQKKFRDELLAETQKNFNEFNVGARSFELDALEVSAEHQRIFGQPISVKQLVLDSLTAKKAPKDYWEEKYNVAAKRKELSDAASAAHDAEVEKRGYEKRIAEEANPATRTMTSSKNPFYVPASDGKTEQQPWDQTGPSAEEQALMTELQRARAN